MAQVVPNFVRTTLRAPITISDTQLQLAAGGGAFFNFTAGDWCFLTVNDSVTVEVMKYTSTGSVINDTITVERAQDDTTAKAFPAGACVTVGWNQEQVYDFILQTIAAATPADTQTLSSVNAVPSGAPPTGIIYTVNLATGQMWYWDGLIWIAILSNSVRQVTDPPAGAPPFGTIWAIIAGTGALYYWTGSDWIQVSGSASTGLVEILSKQYLLSPQSLYNPGAYTFATSGLMTSATTAIDYHTNPLVPTNITIPNSGPNDQRIVFTAPCIAEITVAINGFPDDVSFPVFSIIELTHTGGNSAFNTALSWPPTAAQTSFGMVVSTGPVAMAANDAWDMNFVVSAGITGATYSGLEVNQFTASVIIYAMTPAT